MADRTLIPADPELWRRTGHAYPACTADACRSGRAPCPCPNECRLPEPDDKRRLPITGARPLVLYLIAGLLALICGAALLLGRA